MRKEMLKALYAKGLISLLPWQWCTKPKRDMGWSPESSGPGLCGTGSLGQD